MKILQVCSKIPFPSKDGGSIAMNLMTDGLISNNHEVTVLALRTPKNDIPNDVIPLAYRNKTSYHSVYVDTNVKAIDAFINLFTSKSYNIIRFYSQAVIDELKKLLTEHSFDIVQLETLWVTPYIETIRRYSTAKIILRSHNVEFIIWERLAMHTKNPVKRWYLSLLAKRLKQDEVRLLNSYDGIACITQQDQNQYVALGCTKPIIHIPFGIRLSEYIPANKQEAVFTCFHIGAMDWMPNEEGVKWLLKNVWLRVLEKNNGLNLYLAGRNMPAWLVHLKVQNVIIAGEVKNASDFINSHSIMLVPLQSGGGMRVKIIEGMALAKVIISTSIGAEGINYENKKNILIADTAEEFVEAIEWCTLYPEQAKMIGDNARELVKKEYDNQKIGSRLSEFYKILN